MSDAYERAEVTSREQWRAWPEAHHATSPGIWLAATRLRETARPAPENVRANRWRRPKGR